MKTSRRRFLKLGIVGGALVATGSIVAFLRTSGYSVAPERERALVALSVWQLIVVEQAARRITASDVADVPGVPDVATSDVSAGGPRDAAIPSSDDTDVPGFVDRYVAKLPPATRKDLLRFLAYVEHLAPLALKLGSRFSRLPPVDQDRVLASLEASETPLLRAGFEGLKSLVFMGYYRDPRTWKILDYAGPWVNRPQKGWW